MRTLTLIAALCALAVAGVGCGTTTTRTAAAPATTRRTSSRVASGDRRRGGGRAQTLKLSADPGGALEFDKSSLTAKAGKVTIVMDNPSDLPHAVEVEGNGVEEIGDTVGNGGVSRVSADLKAGEYEYYCPVGNHKDAGMEGTLTVQ